MPDGIRWVGLDVHARESTLAVFGQATGEVVTRRVVGRPHELLPWLRGVARPARRVAGSAAGRSGGAWLSSSSWENFADYFGDRGFAVSAPRVREHILPRGRRGRV